MSTAVRVFPVRWVLRSGTSMCWVPNVLMISDAGEIVLEAEGNFVKMFRDWIAASIKGNPQSLTGELVSYDSAMAQQERWAFTSAGIRALTFPTLDASLDVAGRVIITARASSVKPLSPSKTGSPVPVAMAQSLWKCRDFSVTIGALDTSKVSHVDALSFTTPGTFPDVRILVQESAVAQFVDWRKQGTSANSTIVCRTPNLQPLFTLSFSAKAGAIASPGSTTIGSAAGARVIPGIARVPVSLKVASLSFSG